MGSGGTEPDQLVQAAIPALQDGFDGAALQQLAGLSQPTLRDLGNLPAKAFAEMGLKLINRNEAVALLLANPCRNPVISALREAFPDFGDRWKETVVSSRGGEPGGPYSDIAQFAHFVIEDTYEKGKLDETRHAFELLEKLLVEGDQETTDLIGLASLRPYIVASHRPRGNKPYQEFFGPKSEKTRSELRKMWAGKFSLMDVIRAERIAKELRESKKRRWKPW